MYIFEFLLGHLSTINPILVPFQLAIPNTGYGRTVKTMKLAMFKPSFDDGTEVLVSFRLGWLVIKTVLGCDEFVTSVTCVIKHTGPYDFSPIPWYQTRFHRTPSDESQGIAFRIPPWLSFSH